MSVWHSPVFMTWGAWGARALSFVTLLPLTLALLPAEEVAVWFLFFSMQTLAALVDFGFAPTFVRAVAYANAGAGSPGMDAVIRTMRSVYARVALAGAFLAAVPGTFALWNPIAQLREPSHAWLAWAMMACATVIWLRSLKYWAFLHGSERTAVLRRAEIAVGLSSLAVSCAVLLAGGGLAGLACIHLAAAVAGYALNRALARRHAPAGAWDGPASAQPAVMHTVFPAAWRSGLGASITYGVVQGSGVFYAQLAAAAEVASYLLALRLMQEMGAVSSVPLSARLPALARLYADGRRAEVVALAGRGMLWGNWLFLGGVAALGVAGEGLLASIGGRTAFVPGEVWWLLGAAFLVERIGTLHLELYGTTNRVAVHVANGVCGLVMIAAMALAYRWLGVAGLPLGMLAAYAGFYTPFSMRQSYRAFGLAARFDLAASAAPLAICLGVLLAVLAR
ncbi:MAG TPA: hypothetical protein VFB53_01030 [Burkholderiales bacterium]|nr:hypothetical protein [Burkholderiales bacterium]